MRLAACPHGREHRVVVLEHGEHEDRDRGRGLPDLPGRGEPVEVGHPEVEHDDVGLGQDHLANGVHTFTMGWGIVTSRRALGKLNVVVALGFVILLAMGWGAIYAIWDAGAVSR